MQSRCRLSVFTLQISGRAADFRRGLPAGAILVLLSHIVTPKPSCSGPANPQNVSFGCHIVLPTLFMFFVYFFEGWEAALAAGWITALEIQRL